VINCSESLSMAPHSGVGGCAPSPKKLKPAASSTAEANPIVDCTMMGVAALGRMTLNIRRILEEPLIRLAMTYSFSRSASTEARTTLA